MIEGDHRSELGKIFKMFDYEDTGKDLGIKKWNEITNYLSDYIEGTRVVKAVCFQQGWTIIIDPEMVMFSDEEACIKVSSELKSRVFGMICEGTSGTYGFTLFDNKKIRGLLSTNSQIVEDFGVQLPSESKFDKSKIFEDDIVLVMRDMGVDYGKLNEVDNFVVKELESAPSR
jgi:hypothetical protein